MDEHSIDITPGPEYYRQMKEVILQSICAKLQHIRNVNAFTEDGDEHLLHKLDQQGLLCEALDLLVKKKEEDLAALKRCLSEEYHMGAEEMQEAIAAMAERFGY